MAGEVLVLRHVANVPLGAAADSLAEAGLAVRGVDLYEHVPADLPWQQAAGLVILGGPMSANDGAQYPFLDRELEWIRQALDRDLPTLGICLGAQLMAKALGGRVYRNRVREIGWYELEMLPPWEEDPVWGGCQPRETVFQWHGDTFDLPPGAVHLARSPDCANQVFRLGRSAYGVQFHIEMTPTLLDVWLSEKCDLPDASAEAIRARGAVCFPPIAALREQVLRRFCALCQGR